MSRSFNSVGTVGVAFFERSLESNHNRLLFRTSSSAPKEVVKTEFLECRCSEERYATTRPRPMGRSMGCRISNGAVLLNPDGSDASERARKENENSSPISDARKGPPAGRPAEKVTVKCIAKCAARRARKEEWNNGRLIRLMINQCLPGTAGEKAAPPPNDEATSYSVQAEATSINNM